MRSGEQANERQVKPIRARQTIKSGGKTHRGREREKKTKSDCMYVSIKIKQKMLNVNKCMNNE